MKLALDPQMFFASHSVWELPDVVASLGYSWMELSPKADFVPFFKHPRVDDAGVRKLKKVAADAGAPLGRLLRPDDIAPMVTYLLSDAARMVTGSVIDFDQTVHGPYGEHVAPAREVAA